MNSVCWNITHKCNRNCKYCFREEHEKDLTIEENIEILNNLINLGIRKITWSGGEPTEYEGLDQLLMIAKKRGLYNKIVTNASNLKEKKSRDIIKYIDEITFSIDSTDDDFNEKMGRGKDYFKEVMDVIKIITIEFPNCKISINTIVMKNNIEAIDKIYEALSKLNIMKWKLLQFCSFRGVASKNKDNFFITNEEYINVLNKYINKKKDFDILGHTADELEKSHIIVTSSGLTYKA